LLLAVFGLTLLVGGLAQQLEVSAAIGAFLVGLALSGPVQHRVGALVSPLRDLFAAMFFLFFAFQIRPGDVLDALVPALALAAVAITTKMLTGWFAAGQVGTGRAGRLRAGATLIARGEFSIVIASLGATLDDGDDLGALAAAFVLLTAVAGPVAARFIGAPHPGGAANFSGRSVVESATGSREKP
jgi:monovalent cation:H+ antiporter-2, CPA2 family